MVTKLGTGHSRGQICGVTEGTQLVSEHGAADHRAGHHTRVDTHGIADGHHGHTGGAHRAVAGAGNETQKRTEQECQRQQKARIDHPKAVDNDGGNGAALKPGTDHDADGHQQRHRRHHHLQGLKGTLLDLTVGNPPDEAEQINDDPAEKQTDHGTAGLESDAGCHRQDNECEQYNALKASRFPNCAVFALHNNPQM